MLRRAVILCLLPFLATARPAAAQVEVDITRTAGPRIPIGLVLPDGRPEFNRVLEQDLLWSGFFLPRAITEAASAAWEVFLVCRDDADGGIAAQLFSAGPGGMIFNRLFRVSPRDERYLAHTVAKAIIEELTGQPAITLTRITAGRQTGKNKEIVLLDYDGGRRRALTADNSLNRHPRFSPDGKSIVYTSFLHYWPVVYHQVIATGERRIVASYPGLNTAAVFHPDGKTLALSLSRDGNPGDLYLLDPSTRELERLTNTRTSDTSPVFSPDGRSLVFVSDRSGQPHLYLMSTADRGIRRLTFESSYNTSPTLSPDGRFVAYTARVDGQMEIRLIDLDADRDYLLTSGPGRKEDPAFAPNSRHLVYVHTAGRRSDLKLLDIFTRESYTITSDGGYSTPDWR